MKNVWLSKTCIWFKRRNMVRFRYHRTFVWETVFWHALEPFTLSCYFQLVFGSPRVDRLWQLTFILNDRPALAQQSQVNRRNNLSSWLSESSSMRNLHLNRHLLRILDSRITPFKSRCLMRLGGTVKIHQQWISRVVWHNEKRAAIWQACPWGITGKDNSRCLGEKGIYVGTAVTILKEIVSDAVMSCFAQ